MKIDILTLFPNMFENVFNESIIKRAVDKKLVDIKIHDIRDYTTDKHNRVDDYAFGGGKGMVLMPEPVYNAIEDVKTKDSIVIMMTPQGKTYNQKMAYQFSKQKHIIILCGHYEGFDERIRSFVDLEISVGDYVLTGGEIPSMIMVDSIVRLVDGVGGSAWNVSPKTVISDLKASVTEVLSGDIEAKLAACRVTLPEQFTYEVNYKDLKKAYQMSFYPDIMKI